MLANKYNIIYKVLFFIFNRKFMKYSNKISNGGLRNVPISQRQRARVLQMLDVSYDKDVPVTNLSTLIWDEALQVFKLMPAGWIMWDNYDCDSFTVSSWTTDYDVLDNQAALFDSVPNARRVQITTDADISVRFNSVDNDARPLTSTMNPYEFSLDWITNMYITTGASDANITILLVW